VLVTLRDVTCLRDTQADLEENRRLVQAFEETDQAIVALLEPDGTLREINRFGRELLGYGDDDVGRLNWFQDVASPERHEGDSPESSTESGLYPRGANCPARTRAGLQIPVRWYDAALRDATGALTGRLIIGHDLTEQFETERQLRQSHKMQAVGELAGGLAHDFNNILTAILGNAQILEMEFSPDQVGHEELQQIIQASHRAADLTSKLLTFSRKNDFAPTEISLHETIEETIGLLRRTIDPLVNIETQLDCDDPIIQGDPAQLQSVLLNLGLNARDAIAEGGTLRFITDRCEITPTDSRVTELNVRPGQYIRLQVADTGSGMAPEVRDRIFEPFFTTKDKKKGTGLGLSNAYRCISDHQGHIRVESEPGQGTSFHIYLPLRSDRKVTPSIPAENRPPQPIRATVLLVDDDPGVLQTQARLLEHLHCHVHRASTGQDAVELFQTHHKQIDLVLLDRRMPGLDGLETLSRLRQIDPDTPILICSGEGPCSSLRTLLDQRQCGLLPKPFDLQQVRACLQQHVFSA
jgi:two-component system, cell cycle sensor histidine kinase and response regulator CckA